MSGPSPTPSLRSASRWIVVCLFLAALLSTRACRIGEKPLHHDESLFGYYAYYLAVTGQYDYDPILHGPLLIEVAASAFRLFGDSDTTLRLVPLVCGLLLFALLLALRPWLGKRGMILALLLFLLSPNLCYYSRFLRTDMLFAMLTLANLAAIAYALRSDQAWPLVLWPVSLALLISTKENVVFVAASQLGFAVLWVALDHRRIRDRQRGDGDPYPTPRDRALHALIMTNVSLVIWTVVAWVYAFFLRDRFPLGGWAVPSWAIGVVATAAWFDAAARAMRHNPERTGLVFRLYESIYCERYWWIAGIALAVVLLHFCYSICLTRPQPLGLLARWAVLYWWGEHATERLHGPFHCYAPQLVLYELPAVGILAVALVRDWWRHARRRGPEVFAWLALGGLIWATTWMNYRPAPDSTIVFLTGQPARTLYGWLGQHLETHWSYLHLRSMGDLFWAATVAYWGLIWTFRSLAQRRLLRGWLIFWLATSYLFYGYAGEKVPWLAVHLVLPLLLLAAVLWQEWTETRPDRLRRGVVTALMAALLAWNAWQTFLVCFAHPTSPAELAIFNHTREPTRRVAKDLVAAIETGVLEGRSGVVTRITDPSNVVIQGEAQWPLTWYLRRSGPVRFEPAEYRPHPLDEVLVTDPGAGEEAAMLRADFAREVFELRSAWTPPAIDLGEATEPDRQVLDLGEVLGLRRLPGEPKGIADKLRYRLGNSAVFARAFARYVLFREPFGQLPALAAEYESGFWTEPGDHPTTVHLVDTANAPVPRAIVTVFDKADEFADARLISDLKGRVMPRLDTGQYLVYVNDFEQHDWAVVEQLTVDGPTSATFVGKPPRAKEFGLIKAVLWQRRRPSPEPLRSPPPTDAFQIPPVFPPTPGQTAPTGNPSEAIENKDD